MRREHEESVAADGVSFAVGAGELVGFLGPNGAGKTTTLKMLSGLMHPTSGEARVLGYVPWKREAAFKRQFALVMGQKNQLWWDLPAAESLELNRVIYGLPRDVALKRIDELTEWLDVRRKLNVLVRELSLGERMKMELVAALLHGPRVLFLDEPTIGLDIVSQQKVREFLREYPRQRGVTILLTSHYMQDIEALCERVILIDKGRLQYDGPLQGIVDKFAGLKVVTLTMPGSTAAPPAPAGARLLDSVPGQWKFEAPRDHVTAVCRELLGVAGVADISIEDPPIEEIMRQFFAGAEKSHG
jgi:ABC-2 type transport system ATP-binding protein